MGRSTRTIGNVELMYAITKIKPNFSIAEIQSNKLYKLRYNLQFAKEQKHSVIVTFGGAYSNHIAALAKYGKKDGIQTVGIIRGEELQQNFPESIHENPTLKEAFENGMQFKFVSRETYRLKNELTFFESIQKEFSNSYIVPEGGTNALAVKGCEEILNEATKGFDIICVPVGTGGTIAGLINSAEKHQAIIGFPALKGNFLENEIKKYTKRNDNWKLHTDFHFGGYAKVTDELIIFINQFYKEHQILLDPIYNAKMVFGIQQMLTEKRFKKDAKILAIHTGGIQGIKGFNKQQIKKQKTQIIYEN